mmetsp:Transcript_15846/g.37895  ORF Transcript_15846/g.37895 Transcript_15846/m.37895 type:complete len:255 (+) Transcript_15846:138-902(+)
MPRDRISIVLLAFSSVRPFLSFTHNCTSWLDHLSCSYSRDRVVKGVARPHRHQCHYDADPQPRNDLSNPLGSECLIIVYNFISVDVVARVEKEEVDQHRRKCKHGEAAHNVSVVRNLVQIFGREGGVHGFGIHGRIEEELRLSARSPIPHKLRIQRSIPQGSRALPLDGVHLLRAFWDEVIFIFGGLFHLLCITETGRDGTVNLDPVKDLGSVKFPNLPLVMPFVRLCRGSEAFEVLGVVFCLRKGHGGGRGNR